MEYEIEERPLQMGEDRLLRRPLAVSYPSRPGPFPRLRPEAHDRAILIPEQEPIS